MHIYFLCTPVAVSDNTELSARSLKADTRIVNSS